ncbi:MAG: hypothetical protein Q8N15_04230, partial [Bacillota bacterium]|nr:hypothetical protein [Bacillota bacterium]
PATFDDDGIRAKKVEVLSHLRFDPHHTVTAQYDGYLREKNVDPASQTETFVFLRAYIDTPRWHGVPFDFITGKKLDRKRSEIVIDFRDASVRPLLWPQLDVVKNRLVVSVSPEEGVSFRLNVKTPGLTDAFLPQEIEYCHDCRYVGNRPEAYERILLDLIRGQSALFTRWDEIETAWRIVDEVKDHAVRPFVYGDFTTLKNILNARLQDEIL